ncbi:DUF2513 domain-containing protein [Chloroflexota bacterium]
MISIIMKRDMDLIRAILLKAESDTHGFAPQTQMEIPNYTQEEINYHIFLLGQAGLATVIDTTTFADHNASPCAQIINLTWQGHEFLDLARENHTWNTAKDTINKIGGASLQVLIAVLTGIINKQLGL